MLCVHVMNEISPLIKKRIKFILASSEYGMVKIQGVIEYHDLFV